ncbi:MAG: hypothetical protein NTW19_07650 [Planctomycetota bacterium]|nr:hypothetical protein [Planctomycetota bacterium]
MRRSLIQSCAMAALCLLLVGCQGKSKSAEVLPDVLHYRLTPSPIEQLRTDAGQVVCLDISSDGSVHYSRAAGGRQAEATLKLTPSETSSFFASLDRAGLAALGKYPEVSTESLTSRGRLTASHELKAQCAGKAYRYYWSDGMFPEQAQPLWENVDAMLRRAEAASSSFAEAR